MERMGVVFFAAFAATGLAFAADVRAQQGGSSDQLEEVVVTAQKRTSTVQDTPISITALTGKDLAERGVTGITDIVDSVPGISMRTGGPGQTELEMRGMTSAGGNSSTVGFYLEDIPLSAPASAQNGKVVIDPNLYDLNRIEVLRGPQGTLYGSGSMGGTIRLIPNAPNLEKFDATTQAILGGTDGGGFNHTLSAMLNLPLANDVAALRLVGTQEHMSGWIDRIVIQDQGFPAPVSGTTRGNVAAAPILTTYKGVNDENVTSVRVALLLKPTERLSITPSVMYQNITQEGLSVIDSQPGTLTNYQPFDLGEPFRDRIDIANLTVQYHFDAFDVTSATSYWTRDEDLRQDGTEEVATVLGAPIYANQGGAGPFAPTSLEDDKSWQSSEELRLTSAGSGPLKWLAGYFYQDFESDWDLYVYSPNTAIPGTINNAFTQIQPTKIIQSAFFGEVSYDFMPQLTGTVGLRRFHYDGAVYSAVSGWLSSSGNNTFLNFVSSERDQGVTPKFDLSYKVDKDLMIYTTASKGFRPGGGNQPIPTSGSLGTQCAQNLAAIGVGGGAPIGFSPDHVWSYELGEKFRSSDARVTLNGAAYLENWGNIQQDVPLPCGFPFTGNLGAARVYGAEVELDAVVGGGLMVALNGGYSHARFTNNPVASQTTIDNRVQDVPDWTSAASLVYRTPLRAGLTFVGRVDNQYVGSRVDVTFQPNALPSYDLTNLRAGVEASAWTATLFVNNIANKVALLTNSPAINVNVGTFNRTAVAPPRNFGVDLTYRFGAK